MAEIKRIKAVSAASNTVKPDSELTEKELFNRECNRMLRHWNPGAFIPNQYLKSKLVRKAALRRGAILKNSAGYKYFYTDRNPIPVDEYGKPIRLESRTTPSGGFWTIDGEELSFKRIIKFEMHYSAEDDVYRLWVWYKKHSRGKSEDHYEHKPLSYWFMTEDEIRQALYQIKDTEKPLHPWFLKHQEFWRTDYDLPVYHNTKMMMMELVGIPESFVPDQDWDRYIKGYYNSIMAEEELGQQTIEGVLAEKQWLHGYGPARQAW